MSKYPAELLKVPHRNGMQNGLLSRLSGSPPVQDRAIMFAITCSVYCLQSNSTASIVTAKQTMILLFSWELIHNSLKTMESRPFASTGCTSARSVTLLLKYTFMTWKSSLTPVREGTETPSTQPQAQLCAGSPAHPWISVRHEDYEIPLFTVLTFEYFQLSHIKPSLSTNRGSLARAVSSLGQHDPAREWGFCTLLGTKWLWLSPGEHHRHLPASLDSLIKVFVQSHRRAKRKPSKFCHCFSLLPC